MKSKIIIMALVGILLVAGLACSSGGGGLFQSGPDPVIVGKNCNPHPNLSDYYVTIDCQILNRGDAGSVTLYGEVRQGGGYWQKSQTVYIQAGETRDVTLYFYEPSFWSSSETWRAWLD